MIKMTEPAKRILEYLEQSREGADAYADPDTFERISRAIAALKSDPETPVDKLFTNRFMEKYVYEIEEVYEESAVDYHVPNDLVKYIRAVLVRSFYDCSAKRLDDETSFIKTNADVATFKKVVARAKCEKKSESDGCFYVTEEEAKSESYMNCLRKLTGKTAFVVVKVEKAEQP